MAFQAPRSETGTGLKPSSGAYVRVRVSGDTPGVARALRVLHDASENGGFEIAEESRPYPNHREPGFRVYVTLRFPVPDGTDAAGRPA